MKTPEEIVKALRESCTGNEFVPPMVTNTELTDAADMIESLQDQLAASQRREKAAVDLIAEVEKMINRGAEWFDNEATEWAEAMERFRGEPGEENRFKMSLHIRDAYRVGLEKFDLAGAKIDRWHGPGEEEA